MNETEMSLVYPTARPPMVGGYMVRKKKSPPDLPQWMRYAVFLQAPKFRPH